MGKPYEIHTRVRQEKGQDIAGACGQLALVNPGSTKSGGEGNDIEDAVGQRGNKRSKPAVRGKKERAEGSAENTEVAATGVPGWVSSVVADAKLTRSKALCYANIAAVPLIIASLWLSQQKSI